MLMKINTVKQKITSGGTSIGTFIFEFNTTGIARLAAQAGAGISSDLQPAMAGSR